MLAQMEDSVVLRVVRMPWTLSLPCADRRITRPNREHDSRFTLRRSAIGSRESGRCRSRRVSTHLSPIDKRASIGPIVISRPRFSGGQRSSLGKDGSTGGREPQDQQKRSWSTSASSPGRCASFRRIRVFDAPTPRRAAKDRPYRELAAPGLSSSRTLPCPRRLDPCPMSPAYVPGPRNTAPSRAYRRSDEC
jgi:hypothetical protein